MAHPTEAACLLETGVRYGTRVLLQPEVGDPIFAGIKSGAISLYFGDAPIVHADLDGRWQRAFFDGLHYLKGLDTSVQSIDRVREGANLVLKRNRLTYAEAAELDDRVRGTARALIASLDAGRYEIVRPPGDPSRVLTREALRNILERLAAWDAAAWLAHHERYLDAYGPRPFVPPDCPSPVILQATVGHEAGQAFGGAVPSVHLVRSPEEFERHAHAVASLLGAQVTQAKSVFLGGSDALCRPVDDLIANLQTIRRVFPYATDAPRKTKAQAPGEPSRALEVHAFLDRFSPPLPGRDAWPALRHLGLFRVTLGIESGDPDIRALYGKTWTDRELLDLAASLKEAKIGVGVVVLIGAGGGEHTTQHLNATAELINALPLGTGDVVSLIDATEVLNLSSQTSLEPLAFTPMGGPETLAQRDELRYRLALIRSERGVKVIPYSMDKQKFL